MLNLSGRREVPEYSGRSPLPTDVWGQRDYQKYLPQSGTYYAHILEESTLYPARYCRAVRAGTGCVCGRITCPTALFAQPYAAARRQRRTRQTSMSCDICRWQPGNDARLWGVLGDEE